VTSDVDTMPLGESERHPDGGNSSYRWPLDVAHPLLVERALRLSLRDASVELGRSARRSLT